MTEQAWWVVALVAVIITGVIGFFIGRQTANSKEKLDELEEALNREKAALADYRDKVDAHFDKTAGLFVSMAGSYKDLFDHLSSGYENLAPGASRELFKERVSALLLESRAPELTPVESAGDSLVHAVSEPAPTESTPAGPATAEAAAPAPEGPEAEAGTSSVEQSAELRDDSAAAAAEASGLTLEKAESARAEATPESGADSTSATGPADDGATSAQTPEAVVDVSGSAPAAAEPAQVSEEGKKPAA